MPSLLSLDQGVGRRVERLPRFVTLTPYLGTRRVPFLTQSLIERNQVGHGY